MSKWLHWLFAGLLAWNTFAAALPPYTWGYLLVFIISSAIIIGSWIFTWSIFSND